ncbi:MAG: hypothetical protein HZC54_17585 [Verrucomicrobia bacterium]|nr:hypothetical protein [Verrucomicrobiota bacterium]
MNLALLRSVNLRLLSGEWEEDGLPARKERLAAHPTATLALLRKKL